MQEKFVRHENGIFQQRSPNRRIWIEIAGSAFYRGWKHLKTTLRKRWRSDVFVIFPRLSFIQTQNQKDRLLSRFQISSAWRRQKTFFMFSEWHLPLKIPSAWCGWHLSFIRICVINDHLWVDLYYWELLIRYFLFKLINQNLREIFIVVCG